MSTQEPGKLDEEFTIQDTRFTPPTSNWERISTRGMAENTLQELLFDKYRTRFEFEQAAELGRPKLAGTFMKPVYILIRDTADTRAAGHRVVYTRELFTPINDSIPGDNLVSWAKDDEALERILQREELWKGVNMKAIIDLREFPCRVTVVGRLYMPYLTPYDVWMEMVK